jgi:glycosyltransferase involved in cell wall biosynthesis
MDQRYQNCVIQVVRRFSPDHWGANEQTVWSTAKCLNRSGTHTTIFATSALCTPGRETRDEIEINRFNYFYPQIGLNKHKSRQLDLKGGNPYSASLLRALLKTPCRMVHCHTHSRLAAGVRVVAKLKNIPYIVSLNSGAFAMPQSEHENLTSASESWVRYGFALDRLFKPKMVLKDAGGIICPSYDEFVAVRKAYPLKPCLYLPVGIDPTPFNVEVELDIKKKYGIDASKFVLLCSGRIDNQKNQRLLIDLLSHFTAEAPGSFHLILMGHLANRDYFKALKRQISALKLDQHVTWSGNLQHNSEELIACYQQADVLVIPSIHDPMGLPVLEAWANRLPVIAAKTGALNSLLDDQHTGLLFDPFCKGEIEGAVRTLRAHPALKARIIEKGEAKLNQRFLWKHHMQKLRSFYEEIEVLHASHAKSRLIC